MKVLRQPDVFSAVRMVGTPDDLIAFRRSNCEATIWVREPTPRFQNWVNGLTTEQLPDVRVILRHGDVRNAVSRICDICGTPNCSERVMLVDDTAALAHLFAKLMRAEFLHMRLGAVTSNDTQVPSINAMPARLICTYRGSGIKYALPVEGTGPARVSTVPTGSPIVLRGADFTKHPAAKLMHRPPLIDETGGTRLVLVLDPVANPGDCREPIVTH